MRAKIHAAYEALCPTREELLRACVAIEEDMLHLAAPSRLDYFKSGFEFETRVALKQKQLRGDEPSQAAGSESGSPRARSKSPERRASKRARS